MICIPLASPRATVSELAQAGLMVKLELEYFVPTRKGVPLALLKGTHYFANQVTSDLSEGTNCVAEIENPADL